MNNQDSETRIKVAARKIFSKKGYQGTTLAEIANEAGISPALIYRHFKNKKALFETLEQPELDFLKPSLQARKNEILEAALQVFSKRGFAEATMDEIAEAAGLSKAALYLDFSSKEDLFRSLASNPPSFQRMEAAFAETFNGAGKTLEESLRYIASVYLDLFDNPQVLALTRIILVEGTRSLPVAEVFRGSIIERGTNLLCGYLSKSVQEKNEHLELKVRAFYGFLFSQVLLKCVLVQAGPDAKRAFQAEKDSLVSLAVSMFLNGVIQS